TKSSKSENNKKAAADIPADSEHFAEALTQSYTKTDGSFTLSSESRFYIVSEDMPSDELYSTVRLMDAQFAAYGLPAEKPLPVVYGKAEKAEAGDIIIDPVTEDGLGIGKTGIKTADINQAYILNLGEKAEISACGTDGIYYGLLTLMGMLREKQNSNASRDSDTDDHSVIEIGGAVIADGPELAERAVLLDCGRRYFKKEWIKNFIRRCSMQRYNAVVMHFAEAEGLRLDSRVFPWLTKGMASLTMDEMSEIIATARTYHVEIIPSFDMPGHNTYMVKKYARYVSKHPKFSFKCDGKTYSRKNKGFGTIANHWENHGETRKADYIGIDVTKKHAVAFVNALVDDYADFFAQNGCSKFDIGGDELLGWYSFELGGESFSFENRWKALDHWTDYASEELGIKKGSASDTYVNFLNTMAERLEARGFTCRVFNDDLDINSNQHVKLNKSIEVVYWFPANNSAKHFAEQGHKVHNFVENWCFYVLRKNSGKDIMTNKYKSVNGRNIFENWDPRKFTASVNRNKKVPRSKLAGGYFAIWCDHPDYKSDKEIWEETEYRMWANASKMWNPEVSTSKSGTGSGMSYGDMKDFAAGFDGFPGFSGKPGKESSLPEPAELEAVKSWWQDLIAF
ncbi:MAG: family 20 glycosylhydrolase, partial [Mogibacterium sp.]|nr:family 20 glycosylhydrolase [Mogibacterium sp.]